MGTKVDNATIVHGHTPTNVKIIASAIESNNKVICIDGGCVYDIKKQGLTHLCAVELNSLTFYKQKNIEQY